MQQAVNVFWFRRDLRLNDNTALFHSLNTKHPVLPIFIFDTDILDKLTDKFDARVEFIHNTISSINKQLQTSGSGVLCLHGKPIELIKRLVKAYTIKAVYANNDYEPYAIQRDREVSEFLKSNGIQFYGYKDHVIFEKNEIVKENNEAYSVFTPYSRKWLAKLGEGIKESELTQSIYLRSLPSESYSTNFLKSLQQVPTLESIGFKSSSLIIPPDNISTSLLVNYENFRDFPGLNATSKLGIHLRFGTISLRELVKKALGYSLTFVKEIIWRDFYSQILWHFPFVEHRSFKQAYDNIEWRNNEAEFKAWCTGQTGYPLVDAGMRELNATGFMHNRIRMVTASFLTKHLLIDWRWGESYFASKLLDYDLASNNGGWQWASGSGTDAAPYFRIFNPTTQMNKFDPDLDYVRKWVPEYGTANYPPEIVEHKYARLRCLNKYKEALTK